MSNHLFNNIYSSLNENYFLYENQVDPNAQAMTGPAPLPQPTEEIQPPPPDFNNPQAMPPDMMGGATPAPLPPSMMPDFMTMGMPEQLDPVKIGKVFVLRNIYAKLTSVNEVLFHLSSKKFDKIREYVDECIDHFQIIIRNFDQFQDKLDDIILLFQRFLVGVVDKMEVLMNNDKYEQLDNDIF